MGLGATIILNGEITTGDDLEIDCRIEGGPVWSDGRAVTVTPAASVSADIVAREVTVFGSVTGTVIATEVVLIRSSATVTGRVVSPRIILEDGARFNGSVEPHQLESALRVARHRRGS